MTTQNPEYRPRLLDLFCGAGGASVGYHRAGFEVVGVDIKPQPNYPFQFWQGDALEELERILDLHDRGFYNLKQFDAIHASPPCPRYSAMTRVAGAPEEHPDLMAPTRELLLRTGLPFVIENVVGAPMVDPVRLCGSALGLGAQCRDGKWRQLRRHRLFEANFAILVPPCTHEGEPVGVYGNGGGQQKTVWNGGRNRGYMASKEEAAEAMGIDWMLKREIKDAVPPAYTELVGAQLLARIESQVAHYDRLAR